MAYTTKTLLRSNSGFTDSTLVADSILDAKIAYADGLINAKIAAVYALPLTVSGAAATPDIIAMLSLEISTVLLLMAQYTEQAQDTDKGWEKRLKMAQSVLDDIASLKSRLFNASGVEFDRSDSRRPAYLPSAASEADGADPSSARSFERSQVF